MTPRSFTEWLLSHRILVLVASFIVLMICASGVMHLDFSADYRVLFSDKNPQLKAFEEMESIYGKRDNLMIVIAPDDDNIFTKKSLKVIRKLIVRISLIINTYYTNS